MRDNGLGVGREWCNKIFDMYQNVGAKKKGAWTKVWAWRHARKMKCRGEKLLHMRHMHVEGKSYKSDDPKGGLIGSFE